jgi:hypothetical protein
MLGGLVGLRPEERKGALVAFLAVFGILGAHTLLETARDALFLARLPATRLPWVYLAIAVVAVVLSLAPGRGRVRVSGAGAYSLSAILGLCALVTFAFWAVGSSRHPVALYALYIWTGIEGSLAPLEFWLVLGEKYTVTQAKRIFGFVGVGSLLGAVAGAGLVHLAGPHVADGDEMSQLLLVGGGQQGGLVDFAEIGFQRRLGRAGFAGRTACSGGVFTLRRGHGAAPFEWWACEQTQHRRPLAAACILRQTRPRAQNVPAIPILTVAPDRPITWGGCLV